MSDEGRAKRWVVLLSAVALVLGVFGFVASLSTWLVLATALAWGGLSLSVVGLGLAFQKGAQPWAALGALALCVYVLVRVHELHADATAVQPPNEPAAAIGANETLAPGQPEDSPPSGTATAPGQGPASVLPPEQAGAGGAATSLPRPGPLALSSRDLAVAVGADVGDRVAAPWQGMWFEAEVIAVDGDQLTLHIVGWEAAWDTTVNAAAVRALPAAHVTVPSPHLPNTIGATEPMACGLQVIVFALDTAEGPLDFAGADQLGTVYALRIHVSGADPAAALRGVPVSGAAVGLAYTGSFSVAQAGSYRFELAAPGPGSLHIDEQVITGQIPVQLAAGSHRLEVRLRFSTQAPMSISLSMTGADGKPRILDLSRHGEAQVVRKQDGSLRVALEEAVLFRPGSATLDPTAQATLERLWPQLERGHEGGRIVVEGHTDDLGAESDNLRLSEQRAQSVVDWLLERGRPPSSVVRRAFGETRPRVDNRDAASRALNRRVEFELAAVH